MWIVRYCNGVRSNGAGVKGVFEISRETRYDDEIAVRYHFPDSYLAEARPLVGDCIVYRETRKGGGSMGYIGVAGVDRIEQDLSLGKHSYAFVSDLLRFDRLVSIATDGRYAEALLRDRPTGVGAGIMLRGKAFRGLSDSDFPAIVRAGLAEVLDPANAVRLDLDRLHGEEDARWILTAAPEEQERQIVQILTNRKLRDAKFRRDVRETYDFRCAVTGLRIINGGGRPEVQAAHIWPVAEGEPDVVQNGLALSGTAHWLFDRHLISVSDDFRLLVSRNKVPAEFRGLFERQLDRIHLPDDRELWPSRAYLKRHRERYLAA